MVVVANDKNLELADEFGHERLEFPNTYLGDKWNAGYVWGGQNGFDHLMPVGSDSLLDPELILHWLGLDEDLTRIPYSSHYAVVRSDGRRRIDCVVTKGGGGGMMLPKHLLAPLQYRPVEGGRQKGCDGSTLRSVSRFRKVRLVPQDLDHRFAVVALQSSMQITSYDRLFARWGVHEERETPLDDLEPVYGADTVAEVKALYATKP